jgi:hypothetical protein
MNVAVLGASNKPDRYSYKAVKLLRECGHQVFPIHPKLEDIEGIKVYRSLKDISEEIQTLTLYVSADKSSQIIDEIVECQVKRIIFNPGSENEELKLRAENAGIEILDACTLVMLKTNQF